MSRRTRKLETEQDPRYSRRVGAIVVWAALMMIVMVGMLAFSIDVGFMYSAQTDLQRSIDAGALAGAGAIADGTTAAEAIVRDYIRMNPVGGQTIENELITVETGHWNPDTETFTVSSELPSAIRARAQAQDLPHFFGPVFKKFSFDLQGEAIAMFQPREIVVALDYSGSMSDDTELRNYQRVGIAEVVQGLSNIWADLGNPTYGNMVFDPVYISSDDDSFVRTTLGLDGVPYPYPSGSWGDYINYVQSSSFVNNAGYRKWYGGLTLANYWQERRDQNYETPTLWATRQQPVTAVKDGLALFLAYLKEVDTDDRVSLVVYSHPTNGAIIEESLTDDFDAVEDKARERQAGHYVGYTDISAGLRESRVELQNNARPGAFKMIVLMTDGVPTSPSGATSAVYTEAWNCADARYPVVTISLGAGADINLMQDVADITGGFHFNIPGGGSVEDYEEPLRDAFREIADHRPLKIVK